MYELKRVMISLDRSELDEVLMKYAVMIAGIFDVEMIYLVHVSRNLQLTDEIMEKYPDLFTPIDEAIEHEIRSRSEVIFKNISSEVKIEILEGEPFDTILRWSGIKEIDLMIMGRKFTQKGTGFLPEKMASVLGCSLLLVPENVIAKMEKILVPFDFSDFSDHALHQALSIQKITKARVTCLHIYEVPTGYHTSGKTFEEFAGIMEENAEKHFHKYLETNHIPEDVLSIEYRVSEQEDLCIIVYNYANEKDIDLIMVGSRGRTPLANLLLGSVAAKLIKYNTNLPLMVVKNKKENMNFFQALMNI